jgi:hypothetical protein
MKLVDVTIEDEQHGLCVLHVKRSEKSKRAEKWYYEREVSERGLVSYIEVNREEE